ncbi:LytR/AlgR family response regulator transcription factor [Ornithinimicrobium cavernae]|uniref:LytR/AlgR family response regulator transcription factor n=1 Tax=Ornithinimicrobium cavernae TaxID=2666047 RepID=UPI000D68A20A|nr:LytTR family DNA-binding domain-containing protein [Ornithinimicrobium cavernae]
MPCVLAVDDEPPALRELAHLLSRDDRVERVLTATDGAGALLVLEQEEVDIVFLDIRMPGLSGLDLARVLARFRRPPAVVFVTAYENHAVDAFDVQAVDYVMKPYRPERLEAALGRALEHIEGPGAAPSEPQDESIPVELGGVTRFVRRSDIRYVTAQGDYARLHTVEGSHLLRAPLASLEERWAEAGFVRIHRSHLIALQHVEEIRVDGGRYTVVVGGRELAVSRRHTRQLRDLLVRRAGG